MLDVLLIADDDDTDRERHGDGDATCRRGVSVPGEDEGHPDPRRPGVPGVVRPRAAPGSPVPRKQARRSQPSAAQTPENNTHSQLRRQTGLLPRARGQSVRSRQIRNPVVPAVRGPG